MTNTENRDAFIKKFHNPLFGAEIYNATRGQAGLSRVFTRAEQKAFNRIANRGPAEDVDDLLIAYRLIGGKIASESRKRLTFLLYAKNRIRAISTFVLRNIFCQFLFTSFYIALANNLCVLWKTVKDHRIPIFSINIIRNRDAG